MQPVGSQPPSMTDMEKIELKEEATTSMKDGTSDHSKAEVRGNPEGQQVSAPDSNEPSSVEKVSELNEASKEQRNAQNNELSKEEHETLGADQQSDSGGSQNDSQRESEQDQSGSENDSSGSEARYRRRNHRACCCCCDIRQRELHDHLPYAGPIPKIEDPLPPLPPVPPINRSALSSVEDLPIRAPNAPFVGIRRIVEYRYIQTDDIVCQIPIHNSTAYGPGRIQPVLEYIDVRVTSQKEHLVPYDKTKKAEDPPMVVTGNPYMRIYSPSILNALRRVVDYYPDISLSAETLVLWEPFPILVHFKKELAAFRELYAPKEGVDVPEDCKNVNTYRDLGVLQDFMDEKINVQVETERARYRRDTPIATWTTLWLLFKPGEDVYVESTQDEPLRPCVVKSISFTLRDGLPDYYTLTVWQLQADDGKLNPWEIVVPIPKFDGEKEIVSLPAFPCEFINEDVNKMNPGNAREKFVERGKHYVDLQTQKCMWYKGKFRGRMYNGLTMVDPENWVPPPPAFRGPLPLGRGRARARSYSPRAISPPPPPPPPNFRDIERAPGGIYNCECKRCLEAGEKMNVRPKFADYVRLDPKKVETLTEHQYFLCDNKIKSFMFKNRDWGQLDVDGFSDPKFEKNLIDDLVIPKDTKDLIKDLTKMYIHGASSEGTSTAWSADCVEGKGEGLIFLLHGKPGVGKTYTAECISEHTSRPLLALTSADIGTTPNEVEMKLRHWFNLAHNWGAIMLLDEADIFMEYRQVQDLERNTLVAVFLRAMEYYKGILFLTTNRVGTFDEAFISRIHVMLYYRDFTDDEREELWGTFFKKLEREREEQMRIPVSTKDYIESKEVRDLKWNGREIRNAFQVAVALAESEGDKDKNGRVLVKMEHIKSTVRMSKSFKTYLQRLYKKDESQRAAIMGHRYDAFDEKDAKTGGSAGQQLI